MRGLTYAMVLVCLTAAINCATVGYDSSMMSSINILKSFQKEFGLSTQLKDQLPATQNLGGVFGELFVGGAADKFVRKGGILISSGVVLVCCCLYSTATTKEQFFVARVLLVIAKAFDIAAVTTCLVELAPPSHRGFVVGWYWICWLLGVISK